LQVAVGGAFAFAAVRAACPSEVSEGPEAALRDFDVDVDGRFADLRVEIASAAGRGSSSLGRLDLVPPLVDFAFELRDHLVAASVASFADAPVASVAEDVHHADA